MAGKFAKKTICTKFSYHSTQKFDIFWLPQTSVHSKNNENTVQQSNEPISLYSYHYKHNFNLSFFNQ